MIWPARSRASRIPSGKLRILDAEDGWFLRMDGMNAYGNSPLYERICIHPSEPLVFFNMDGVPGATLSSGSM